MITVKKYNVKMPSYALPFLINGDDSNLTPDDISNIEKWFNKLQNQADLFKCLVTISPSENEEYFTSTPEFGLPCQVMDCTVTFLQ